MGANAGFFLFICTFNKHVDQPVPHSAIRTAFELRKKAPRRFAVCAGDATDNCAAPVRAGPASPNDVTATAPCTLIGSKFKPPPFEFGIPCRIECDCEVQCSSVQCQDGVDQCAEGGALTGGRRFDARRNICAANELVIIYWLICSTWG